jgi:hypothetical protein
MNAKVLKQGRAMSGVFTGNAIYRVENMQRTQGDVPHIANRGGNHI